MTARTRLLAYIYIVMCGGCIAVGIVLCLGLLLTRDPRSGRALAMIGGGFATFSVFYFIPGLLGGLGLLRGRPWARAVIIVLSLLVILLFPVGTALGGFGLWVLLGPDSKRPPDLPPESLFGTRTLSPADRKRYADLLVVAAGVAAGFVVMIGTGYRVTRTPGSPIGDVTYVASIGVLVLAVVVAARSLSLRAPAAPAPPVAERAASRGARRRLAEERRHGEEERRRQLEVLSADPVRRKYVERIRRGESWSDEQIEYDVNTDRLATCEHLQPIEREMRAAGIEVRLRLGPKISTRCRVDAESLRARFPLPPFVEYAEPQPVGRAYEDPLPALIACAKCGSDIDVVHLLDATLETPIFPPTAGPLTPDASPPADAPTDPYTQLRSRVLALARLIDAPAQLIPTFQRPEGNGLPHIEIDGETYHYVHEERGTELDRFSTTSPDDLLYRLFRDVAFSMSADLARPHRKPGEDFRREMFKQQLALLRRLNPEWESRCAAEHQEVLAKHPFVDDA